MDKEAFVLQSQIERKTGFRIDQLRKWRQRYGFPPAETGVDGGAIYSNDTISKLALIKRLIEAVKALIEQQESRKRQRTCQGCEEDQPNQMAHYGGCIPDPVELLYPNK